MQDTVSVLVRSRGLGKVITDPNKQTSRRWKNWSPVSCFPLINMFSPKSLVQVARCRSWCWPANSSNFVALKNQAGMMCSEYTRNSALKQISYWCFDKSFQITIVSLGNQHNWSVTQPFLVLKTVCPFQMFPPLLLQIWPSLVLSLSEPGTMCDNKPCCAVRPPWRSQCGCCCKALCTSRHTMQSRIEDNSGCKSLSACVPISSWGRPTTSQHHSQSWACWSPTILKRRTCAPFLWNVLPVPDMQGNRRRSTHTDILAHLPPSHQQDRDRSNWDKGGSYRHTAFEEPCIKCCSWGWWLHTHGRDQLCDPQEVSPPPASAQNTTSYQESTQEVSPAFPASLSYPHFRATWTL